MFKFFRTTTAAKNQARIEAAEAAEAAARRTDVVSSSPVLGVAARVSSSPVNPNPNSNSSSPILGVAARDSVMTEEVDNLVDRANTTLLNITASTHEDGNVSTARSPPTVSSARSPDDEEKKAGEKKRKDDLSKKYLYLFYYLERKKLKAFRKQVSELDELNVPCLFIYFDKGVITKGATSIVSSALNTTEYQSLESIVTDVLHDDNDDDFKNITVEDLHKVINYIFNFT